jgi:uncharacterized protein (TIGR02145 family)
MAENLNIGTMIQGSNNMANNSIIEKYCYDNNAANCDVYGGLYQWKEMMQYVITPGAQGLCPTGWHLPSDANWFDLIYFLGAGAGGNMKETGTTHWFSPNTGATNSSGFTALGAGYRNTNDRPVKFFNLRAYGVFWSSTEYSASTAGFWQLHNREATILYSSASKGNYGLSVRCLQD